MPCINPNGQITDSARKLLSAMERPAPLPKVAADTGLPLYRIRSAVRELAQAGLVSKSGDAWQITAEGHAAMARSLTPAWRHPEAPTLRPPGLSPAAPQRRLL